MKSTTSLTPCPRDWPTNPIDEHNIHFEGHAEIDNMVLSCVMPLLDQIEIELNEKFHIQHVTIQLESSGGHESEVIANEIRPHQHSHS